MAGTAPDWDNVRWGGSQSNGLRVPQEMAPATLTIKKILTVNVGGAGSTNTVALQANQCLASYLIVTNAGSGASTLTWPAAFPGYVVVVYNNSGQNAIFEVTGQAGITVANTKRAILVCDATTFQRVTADT